MADLTGLGSIFDFGSKIIDKLFPDPVQKAQATLELTKLQQSGELAVLAAETDLLKGQQAINIEEAKSESLFKSGWRPAVGWTCVAAFAAKYLGGPALFVIAQFFHVTLVLPPIDMTEMLPILVGMLGLGAYRSYDKKQNKTL